jgi:3-hydroxybutyryl-CoA dehydratase
VANRLPGPGTVYISQQMNFRAPVRPGDTVHALVTVRALHRERGRVVLETVCSVGDTVVIDGEAVVKPTSRARGAVAAAAA